MLSFHAQERHFVLCCFQDFQKTPRLWIYRSLFPFFQPKSLIHGGHFVILNSKALWASWSLCFVNEFWLVATLNWKIIFDWSWLQLRAMAVQTDRLYAADFFGLLRIGGGWVGLALDNSPSAHRRCKGLMNVYLLYCWLVRSMALFETCQLISPVSCCLDCQVLTQQEKSDLERSHASWRHLLLLLLM